MHVSRNPSTVINRFTEDDSATQSRTRSVGLGMRDIAATRYICVQLCVVLLLGLVMMYFPRDLSSAD